MKVLNISLMCSALTVALVTPHSMHAQATAKMVACKDGTSAKKETGACKDHGGVKADSAAAAKKAAKPSKAEKAATKAATKTAKAEHITAASGGGPGKVWVNTRSGAFHRETDEFYGKTKQGKYMTEAEALKAGYHEAKASAPTKKP
jgi:hypothetical protein